MLGDIILKNSFPLPAYLPYLQVFVYSSITPVGFFCSQYALLPSLLPPGSPPAPLGAFTDLTGQVTYRYDPDTEIFVRVENMINDEYSTVPGYPHEGALFYAGVVKRF